jgi:hypothetical protein
MERKIRTFVIMALLIGLCAAWTLEAQALWPKAYEIGSLVPIAGYRNGLDTPVEVNIQGFTPGDVIYWNFLSPNGVQIGHGVIPLNGTTYSYSFSLAVADGNGHPNQVGYLIFTYDNDGTLETTEDGHRMTAQAVWLNIIDDDATFLPSIPLVRADYANADLNLDALDGNSIVGLLYGFSSGEGLPGLDVSYWIDPAFSASTSIIVWTSQTPPAIFDGTISTVNGGPFAPVTMAPSFSRLNEFVVATDVTGIPAGYVDGVITMGDGGGDRFMFSLIRSGGFGAVQTFLAAQRQNEF